MNMFLEALQCFHAGEIEESDLFGFFPSALAHDEAQVAVFISDLNQARIKGWVDAALYQRLHLAISNLADATVISRKNVRSATPESTVLETSVLKSTGQESVTAQPNSTKTVADEDKDATLIQRAQPQAQSQRRSSSDDITELSDEDFAGVRHNTTDHSAVSQVDTPEPVTEINFANGETELDTLINLDKRPGVSFRETTDVDDMVGRTINGRFVLENCIGRGGMGTVYKALDLRKEEFQDRDPYVAIKFLNHELRDTEEALFALQREAKKTQVLAHPNVVTVHDFDRDGDLAYLSMEFLEGKTLDQVISDSFYDKSKFDSIIRVLDRTARGLAYAHQEGFVHADLKPSNIFLTNDGNVKILDFGIAQAVRSTVQQQGSDLTQFDVSSLGGITPGFASPEMLEEKAPMPADDIYALGCVAYALFTGSHPFVNDKGRKLTALEARAQRKKVASIPGVPRRYMQAIRRSLQFKREDRYRNAGEFLDAIKPLSKVQRTAVGVIAVLTVAVVISWWFNIVQFRGEVKLDDLPESMAELSDTIRLGDTAFDAGDIDQAHKLYSQAWESFRELDNVDPSDQYRFKTVADQRVDRVTSLLLSEIEKSAGDEFRLLQLQLALEFLKKGGVGSLEKEINVGLIDIQQRLKKVELIPPQ